MMPVGRTSIGAAGGRLEDAIATGSVTSEGDKGKRYRLSPHPTDLRKALGVPGPSARHATGRASTVAQPSCRPGSHRASKCGVSRQKR